MLNEALLSTHIYFLYLLMIPLNICSLNITSIYADDAAVIASGKTISSTSRVWSFTLALCIVFYPLVYPLSFSPHPVVSYWNSVCHKRNIFNPLGRMAFCITHMSLSVPEVSLMTALKALHACCALLNIIHLVSGLNRR